MFDISELKEMKLPELQEIAKKAKINKYRGLKKDELIYQILDQRNVTVALYHHDGCPFFIALGKWCVF